MEAGTGETLCRILYPDGDIEDLGYEQLRASMDACSGAAASNGTAFRGKSWLVRTLLFSHVLILVYRL